jgi:hypothetical protein
MRGVCWLERRCADFMIVYVILAGLVSIADRYVKSQGPAKSVVPCSMRKEERPRTVDLKLGMLELG